MNKHTMNKNNEGEDYRSLMKDALLELKDLRAKLKTLEHARTMPIAIIGMSCQFPGGADSSEAFWQLLHNGVDAITEVPRDRWDIDTYYDPDPNTPGKMYTRYGGFLDQLQEFDPQFFGISPREAVSLDPQQRLLLEVSWNALENSSLVPDRLIGSQTGVFIGICSNDYSRLLLTRGSTKIDAYMGTGNAHSTASGRLSYTFGLQGPSLSLDTACSSSLMAVHLACQSLRNKECDLALAGGVNRIISPEFTINFSKARMLAPDGRCKTFDAAADGYTRAEGCGMIILKRLSDAITDHDNILALIRGSAVNQDGRSSGLTVPNGPSQQAVIRKALENARVAPAQVSYVEAHGTGTSLGDPIELRALAEVFDKSHDHVHPLIIGSVKTNIGHLEAAAGIAGLIKVVLALQHKEIPPHLHFHQPTPYFPWNQYPLVVPTEPQPWIVEGERRIAGVSTFGFSGTNVHIIIEEAPKQGTKDKGQKAKGEKQMSKVESQKSPLEGGQGGESLEEDVPLKEGLSERPLYLLTLSAKTELALKDLASRYVEYLNANPDLALGDICYTAYTCRSHFSHRLSVTASSSDEMCEKLSAFTAGQKAKGVIQGKVISTDQPKIVFLFTGQGSQYVGMGRELYDTQPIFRQTLDHCNEILRSYLEISLLEILYPDLYKSKIKNLKSKINMTAYSQPALFALEYALTELWRSWDITPSIVIGHSVGEYVAACIAGVFSLQDGLKLIAERARLMQALPQNGQMIAAMTDEATISKVIEPYVQEVSMAAINGPRNVVISGKREAIEAITTSLQAEGIQTKPLSVSHAFHSPLMEPMLKSFEQVARKITFLSPQIDLISNVSGQLATEGITTPEYWCQHIRQPVRFAASMETLLEQGYDVFLEIGPKPILLGLARQIHSKLETRNSKLETRNSLSASSIQFLPSLRQRQSDWQQLLQSLGNLYVRGIQVDWVGFDREYPRHRIALPTYPFQRQRYWVETEERPLPLLKAGVHQGKFHPMLGQQLYTAILQEGEILFESQISQDSPAFLKHHRAFEEVIPPTAGYLEMAIAAGSVFLKSGELCIEEAIIQQAIILENDETKTIQVILTPEENSFDTSKTKQCSFRIFSLLRNPETQEASWVPHVSGKILERKKDSTVPQLSLNTLQTRCTEEVSIETFYQEFHERGIDYGDSFRGVKQLWRTQGEALGFIQLPEELELEVEHYTLHPALLDAAMQVGGAALALDPETQDSYLPVGVNCLRVYRSAGSCVWSHAQISQLEDMDQESSAFKEIKEIRLFTPEGEIVAVMEGLLVKKTNREAMLRSSQKVWQDWLYHGEWVPQMHPEQHLPSNYLPNPEEIREYLNSRLVQQLTLQTNLINYQELLMQLEELSVEYILKAFWEMEWEFQPSKRFSTVEMAEQIGIVSQYQRLFNRLLEILEEEKILCRINGQWEVTKVPKIPSPQEHISKLFAHYPAAEAELTLLERCGSELSQVLRGESDPLQLLFPDGDLTTATRLYQNSPGFQVMNTLVQQAITSALEYLPPGRIVRILEIGAGTGATTSYILPRLPANQTEYVFTDISPLFTTQAKEKLQEYPFVRYQVLNIEQPPDSQGFDANQFDLIVATNVLHTTRDLRQTLHHVRHLLASGGMLVLLEGTSPLRWVDLVFGLTEGWWRFADDDLRPSHALLSAPRWKNLLEENGFQHAVSISPDRKGGNEVFQQAIIVAQADCARQKVVGSEQRSWLILADAWGTGQQLATLLRTRGEKCILVFPGQEYEQIDEQAFKSNPNNVSDFQQIIQHITTSEQPPLYGIVHLWSLDACETQALTKETLYETSKKGCGSIVSVVQTLLSAEFSKLPRLWLITRNAQPTGKESLPLAIAQSPLWGIGRVISLEHPELWGGMIDLPSDPTDDDLAMLLEEICTSQVEDHIAFRDGQRYVARLVRSNLPEFQNIRFTSQGVYLITGGLGFLGLKLARWMIERGARHLVLTGRSGLPERDHWSHLPENSDIYKRVKAVQALEEMGATVVVYQADVSDLKKMTWLFKRIKANQPPLKGIIHTAGIFEFQTIQAMEAEALFSAFRPKVMGTWLLHQLSLDMNLDIFVCFSSASSVWGAKGQGYYAAANHFLDVFAWYRHSLELPALTINWGLFPNVGMVNRTYQDWLENVGLREMQPQQGFIAMSRLLAANAVQGTVANVNWRRFKEIYETKRHRPLLDKIVVQSRESTKQKSEQQAKILQQLREVSQRDRHSLLMSYIQNRIANTLGFSNTSQLDVQQPLNNMGLDSLMAIDLRNGLKTDLGVNVPMVKFMEDISVSKLAALVNEQLTETLSTLPVPTSPPAQSEQPTEEIDVSKEIRPEDAEKILTKLDELDDKTVDELLKAMLSKKEEKS